MRGRLQVSLAAFRSLTTFAILLAVAAGSASATHLSAHARLNPRPAETGSVVLAPAQTAAAPESWLQFVLPAGERVRSVQVRATALAPWTGVAETATVAAEPRAAATGCGAWHGFQIASVRVETLVRRGDALFVATEVDVQLDTEPGAALPLTRLRANPVLAASEREEIRVAVVNPEAVERCAPAAGSVVAKRRGFQPAGFPDLEGSDVEYVIVTSAALAPSFQVLADWKTRRGVPTVVRTIESIQATYRHGSDVQETVRTFLRDAYSKWSLQWVLLGGDTSVLPARYLVSSFGETSPQAIPSDLYFAGLDGTWNADGDALWGEAPKTLAQPDPDGGDLYAEIYVGRAPVETAGQAAAFVQKIIAYETPADYTYQGNRLFLGEVLFPVNWDTSQTVSMDGAQLSEDMIAQEIPPSLPVVRRYETYPEYPGSLPLSQNSSISDMDAGYNIVNHIGHGYRYNMSVGDRSIVNADADALTNGNRTFILNILNCTSLAFDYSCLGEHFLLNPNGGAVAVLGASRSAYPLPARDYQSEFYNLLFNQNVWHAGELFARSRLNQTPLAALESAHRWSHYIYNLLGEPEMTVFADAPAALTVSKPGSASLGLNTVQVGVHDSGAVPIVGARVCLQKGSDDYEVGTTGADGLVTLSFTAESAGSIDVTVSGRGLRTYLGTIDVQGAAAGSYVHLQSVTLDDDNTGGTSGNGDGVLDAGETVDLIPTLRNEGSQAAAAVSGSVSVADAAITVLTGAFTTAAIPGGGTAVGTPVRLRSLASTGDHHVFEMIFDLVAGSATTQDKLRREVHAPQLKLVRLEVIDNVTGNGNGEPDEGETYDLRAYVKNYGSGRADGVTAQLQTSSHQVTLVQPNSTYGTIASMSETPNVALFRLIEETLVRNFINLRLTDSQGRLVVLRFEVRRPSAPEGAVLDPSSSPTVILATWPRVDDTDLAGYHVYRSTAAAGPWTRATVDYTNRIAYFRDTGLATNTRYYYTITAVDSSGNESVPAPSVAASTNPPQASGWPVPMAAETASSPAIGDLDGDGLPEIVQGDDHVYAWHGNGEEVCDADGNPQTWGVFDTSSGTTNASVVLAEIDGTAGLEVFACNWYDNSVFALDGNGTLLWTRKPQNGSLQGYWGTPAAGDVDRDGRNELFAASKDGRVYAWNHDGSPLLPGHADGQFATVAAYSRSSPALGNVDDDFELEIVMTDVAGNLYAWNADGSSLPGFPKAYGMAFYNSPILGDVDHDGRLEIVAVSQSGSNNLHCMRGDGSELTGFPFTVPMKSASVSPSPALADLDGDGKLEIIIASNDYVPVYSKVYIYRWNGALYPGWPQNTDLDSESSPVVADFDGDGYPDIVFGGQNGVLHGWKRDGTELNGFPLSVGDYIRGTPAVGDLDGDGNLDLALAGWDRNLYVWDFPTPYNAALAQWPSFLHDAQRTGTFGFMVHDATDTGGDDAARLPRRLELAQNQPNPFNPSTEIRFGVPVNGGRVRLDIYDVKGRHLRNLVDGVLPAGQHRATWDGRDAHGTSLASGVYFYRLQAGEAALTRRMLLLK